MLALYCCSLFDYESSIEYTRLCLECVHRNYGESSSNSIEKWFQLANIQLQAEAYEEALDSYQTSLDLLREKMSRAPNTSSRHSLISMNTENIQISQSAELELRNKMSEIMLVLGNIDGCVEQALLCPKLYQDVVLQNSEEDLETELQILFRLARCYEIKKTPQSDTKLLHVIEIMVSKFPANAVQRPSRHTPDMAEEHSLRTRILKMCLHPYLSQVEFDTNRRQFLKQAVLSIQRRYANRYTIE